MRDQILARDAQAWGRFADRVRSHGGRYVDAYEAIVALFLREGLEPPSLAEYDAAMAECDYA